MPSNVGYSAHSTHTVATATGASTLAEHAMLVTASSLTGAKGVGTESPNQEHTGGTEVSLNFNSSSSIIYCKVSFFPRNKRAKFTLCMTRISW